MSCAFFTGSGKSHIFTALNNGTYYIYGKFQKNEQKTGDCKDVIRLDWSGKNEPMPTEEEFRPINGIYRAEITAKNVQLHEKSQMHLTVNCNQNIRADFRVEYRSE